LRGYDAGKKVKGRKRHILVDTQGFLLKVQVQPASMQESEGGQALLETIWQSQGFARLKHLWVDGGYKPVFVEWVKTTLGWTVEVIKPKPKPKGEYAALLRDFLGEEDYARRYPHGFQVLPRRWVVERTFAWLLHQRRLSKEYDLLPTSSETWIYLTSSRLLLRRLAHS
jgi:putative transposase